MRKLPYLVIALALLVCACAKKQNRIEVEATQYEDGDTISLVTFLDSVTLGSGVVKDGRTTIVADYAGKPLLAQLRANGRVCGLLVWDGNDLQFVDTMPIPAGSELNDKFKKAYIEADSVDNLDDLKLYQQFAAATFNANKENPVGEYFALEWLKFYDGTNVDSLLAQLPEAVVKSSKGEKYGRWARLRAKTAVGMPYVDFNAENAAGVPTPLSAYVQPGKYTLVDFWASWCRYCIRELPEMKAIYSDFKDKGLEIVGVAVRDEVPDTKGAVEKHQIPWPVLYGTGWAPYEIYGFAGIPHHMLIGPDGKIISRGENAAQLRARLESLLNSN